MGSKWRTSTWGDEISLEYGKALRNYDKERGLFRVFGSNGPIGWTAQPLAPGPGVILGRKGAYRGIEFSREPFFVIDTAYYVVPKTELDMRWLYYAIKHHKLGEIDDGSPIPSTTRSAVYVRELDIPPLAEQKAIACILGSLDDKIELNRRMNKTLEEMARAIFKSWFVDFDPVHAKAAVRCKHPDWSNAQVSRAACPNLKPEIADLFPDNFEDSELGGIPKGWAVERLGDICEKPQYGYTASASDELVGPRFLRITDINKQKWIEWQSVPFCPIDERNYEKYRLKIGDVVIARMADPGHGALIEDDVDAVFASYLIRFRPTEIILGRFVQYWIRSEKYWNLVHGRQSGTTRANLNAQVLCSFKLVVPPSLLLAFFSRRVDVLRSKLVANVSESRTLAVLRDTLLPKLISGELPIKDAEQIVGRQM